WYSNLAKKSSGTFRWNRIDIHSAAQFEPRKMRKPRSHFDVPMIVWQRLSIERGRVDDVVIRRTIEADIQFHKHYLQHACQFLDRRLFNVLETAVVVLGQKPGLE